MYIMYIHLFTHIYWWPDIPIVRPNRLKCKVILVSLGLTTFLAKNKAPPAAEHHHSLAAEHDWGGSCEAKMVENQIMLHCQLVARTHHSISTIKGRCCTSHSSIVPVTKILPFCSRIKLSRKLLANLVANGGTHLYEQCAFWEWTYNSSVKWVVSAQNSWMKQPPGEWCNLRGWKSFCQPKQLRPWRLATFPAEVVSTDRSTRCSLIKSHPSRMKETIGQVGKINQSW